MTSINPVIDDVLGGLPVMKDNSSGRFVLAYPLNALKPLDFMLDQEEHNAQFQRILDLIHPEVSLVEFKQLVKDEVERLESLMTPDSKVESLKAIGGKNLSPFKYSHKTWGLHSFYTSYDFAHKSYEEIQEKYNHRIGAIALDSIVEITLMKQKEQAAGDDIHNYKFYEACETARTRGIEFLVAGSKQNSEYFNELYLDDSIDNLLQNFFHIQSTNPLEAESLYVVKTDVGNVMQYKNEAESASFQAITFRILRTPTSLDSFDVAAKKIIQLKNLDGPSHNSKYKSKVSSSKPDASKPIIEPIVEELDSELYEQIRPLPRVCKEDELDLKATIKPMRRDDGRTLYDGDGTAADKSEAYIPSPYMQSRRNHAFSAKIAKNGLNLPSDYNTPPVEIASDYLASLPTDTDSEKLLASIVIITTTIGSQLPYTIDMLMRNKDSVLKYGDRKLTVKIDETIFASSSSAEFLGDSDNNISFSIPHLLGMQISHARNLITNSDKIIDKDELIEQCKLYLKDAKKQFPKKITLSINTLHRPLKAYAKVNGADMLAANFATATYHTNDRAKMAYNATNKDSQTHSSLVNNYWVELNLDGVARGILGISGEVFTTTAIKVNSPKYAGSSRCANRDKTKEFFSALDENIQTAMIAENNETLFKLVTTKMGYSMSLTAGVRSFNNSTDFGLWSHTRGTIAISEKAGSIAAGLRIIPLCDLMNDGLKSYNDTFLMPRGLKQKICFYDAEKVIPFNRHSVHKVLKEIPNLTNRAVLEEYAKHVPTNTGRHCISKKATELSIPDEFISTFLGHNFSGSEQFGIYSTLDTKRYYEDMRYVASSIAIEFGIGGLSW